MNETQLCARSTIQTQTNEIQKCTNILFVSALCISFDASHPVSNVSSDIVCYKTSMLYNQSI